MYAFTSSGGDVSSFKSDFELVSYFLEHFLTADFCLNELNNQIVLISYVIL